MVGLFLLKGKRNTPRLTSNQKPEPTEQHLKCHLEEMQVTIST